MNDVVAGDHSVEERWHREEEYVSSSCHLLAALRRLLPPREAAGGGRRQLKTSRSVWAVSADSECEYSVWVCVSGEQRAQSVLASNSLFVLKTLTSQPGGVYHIHPLDALKYHLQIQFDQNLAFTCAYVRVCYRSNSPSLNVSLQEYDTIIEWFEHTCPLLTSVPPAPPFCF